MGNFNNSKDQFTELLFENRNKNYGAYAMRKSYDRRMLISTGVTVTFLLIAIILPKLFGTNKDVVVLDKPRDTVKVVNIILDPKVDPPKPEPTTPPTAPPKGSAGLSVTPMDTTKIVEVDTNKYDPNKIVGDPKGVDTTGQMAFHPGKGKDTNGIVPFDTNTVVSVPEVNPEFPGGLKALYKFLKDNIRYPEFAKENEISGTVYLSFVVGRDGSITDIIPMNKVLGGLDKEAIRVAGIMPKWKPGMMGHETVKVKYSIPVKFVWNPH
jgi:protein TonB